MELQTRMLEAVKHIATSAEPIEHATAAAFREFIPQASATDKLGRAADHATKAAALSIFRRLVLDYAQDAIHKGAFPLQYKSGMAAEPVLQRLLSAALWCNSQELVEAASFLSIVDDLQEICTVEHCMDIITWLEDNVAVLASPQIADAPFGVNSFTRVCNGILKRLGKHEVISKARLLMLIATITPLFDRSGLGITGAFAPPDPPTPEQVPENAVDSTGKPVDILLYKNFWNLQGILQNPLSALSSLDQWAAFKKELTVVLENLARTPATVIAARPAAIDAPQEKESRDEGSATQCYLSSYKLFGLQLTDSAFRRDFLVQVLIMLRTLLIPGKVPADTLKPKQRMEALALEREVYKVLELTPRNGKEFCRAVKDVLEREITWVSWKKGGAAFVIPGKEQEAPEAPAGSKRPQQVPQTCVEWSKPLVASLADAVAKANNDAVRQAAKRKRNYADGLQLKQEADHSGRQYDNQGVPPEHAVGKRNRILHLLESNSGVMFWAQARIVDRSLLEQPLLSGMKVTEQSYPTPDAVAAQALREMDPDVGIEPAYRRIAEDAVYRWRVGRIAAHGLSDWDGVEAQKVEDAVKEVMPDKLPAALKAQMERDKAEKAAKAAPSKATAPPKPEQQGSQASAAGSAAGTDAAFTAGTEPDNVAVPDAAAEAVKMAVANGGEKRNTAGAASQQDPPTSVPDGMEVDAADA